MDILIKGWKMPKTCSNCFAYDEDYKLWQLYSYGIVSRYPVQPYDKPKWCELIELPPHGRLIDADALMKHCVMLPMDGGSLPVIYMSYLRNAPTIIEAEE